MKCEQELCPSWTGHGCICDAIGGDTCSCGHSTYDHSAANVVGCYSCECDVDA